MFSTITNVITDVSA